LLRSEIPSGMRAKLRTVAASNNRDHARNLSSRTLVNKFNRSHVNIGRATTSQSLLLLRARATYMMVLFFTHIPFVVNHTFNAIPPARLQHYYYQSNLHQARWQPKSAGLRHWKQPFFPVLASWNKRLFWQFSAAVRLLVAKWEACYFFKRFQEFSRSAKPRKMTMKHSVLYWVTSSLPHARRLNLSMHRSNMEYAITWRKTRIHTWR